MEIETVYSVDNEVFYRLDLICVKHGGSIITHKNHLYHHNEGGDMLLYCKRRIIHGHEEFISVDNLLACIQAEADRISNEFADDYLNFNQNEKELFRDVISTFMYGRKHDMESTSLVEIK